MKRAIIAIAMLCYASAAQAFMLFDVAWNDPPHTANSAPATDYSGTSPDRPSTVQQAMIRTNIPGFAGQAAVLEGAEYSYISFNSNLSFTSGVHRISWWATMLTADPASDVVAQMIDNDVTCSFLDLNREIQIGSVPIGTWALGEVYQFEALLNLDTDTYDFFFNGNQVVTGQSLDPNASISSFGFQRPWGASEFAVDSIQWEVISAIPEPGTASLLLLGLPALGMARHLVPTQKKQDSR